MQLSLGLQVLLNSKKWAHSFGLSLGPLATDQAVLIVKPALKHDSVSSQLIIQLEQEGD